MQNIKSNNFESKPPSEKRELVITRGFDAPAADVWKAWTKPELFARWYGIENSTLSDVKMDVKPGGGWSATMHIPNAADIAWMADYQEVIEPRVLVFTLRNPDNHSDPAVETVAVKLEELAGKTLMSFRQTGHLPAQQYATALRVGWNSFFDRLDELLKDKEAAKIATMDPVVHFEMPYEDPERLVKFYKSAFGWQMRKLDQKMGDYVTAATSETDEKGMLKKPGTINGGFFPRKPDSPAQYPSVVIAVDDIKQAIKKVGEAGGKVLGEPVEVPGIGQYVSFTDTEGNRASLLQPSKL
jgi:uncharacterized protein